MSENMKNIFGILRGGDEIAKALNCSKNRVYHLLESGAIPATKEGNGWVTTVERLRRFYEGGGEGA
jgi:excisionase family DNA binding protein